MGGSAKTNISSINMAISNTGIIGMVKTVISNIDKSNKRMSERWKNIIEDHKNKHERQRYQSHALYLQTLELKQKHYIEKIEVEHQMRMEELQSEHDRIIEEKELIAKKIKLNKI